MKKNVMIIVTIILVIIVGSLTYIFLTNDSRYKKKLENELVEKGKDFYLNFYYEQMEDNIELFKKTGIPISLANLESYKLNIDNFKNKKCDQNKTIALIKFNQDAKDYKKDFTIEPILECNFK